MFVLIICFTHLCWLRAACGTQSLRGTAGIQGLGKVAAYGDWPWQAALFKDGVHVCDATLVSAEWLLTTASCFQGYVLSCEIGC